MTTSGTARVTLPTDEQILITREFDAPKRTRVQGVDDTRAGQALVEPEQGEMTIADIDLRVGGRWRYVMVREGASRSPSTAIPRDRSQRADRQHRGLRGHARAVRAPARRGRSAPLNIVTFTEAVGPHDPDPPRAVPEQGAPRRDHELRHGGRHAEAGTAWNRSRSRSAPLGRDHAALAVAPLQGHARLVALGEHVDAGLRRPVEEQQARPVRARPA